VLETLKGDVSGLTTDLCFSKNLDSQCITQRVDPHQRGISLTRHVQIRSEWRSMVYTPISPVTPLRISSLLNSIGWNSNCSSKKRWRRRRRYNDMDVDVADKVKPMRMPYAMWRTAGLKNEGGKANSDSFMARSKQGQVLVELDLKASCMCSTTFARQNTWSRHGGHLLIMYIHSYFAENLGPPSARRRSV
jgi:hypothetical protein